MSGVAAGLTVFCIFLICAASSADLISPEDPCFHCRIFSASSTQVSRDEKKEKPSTIDFLKDEKALRSYCLKACPNLFKDPTENIMKDTHPKPDNWTHTEVRKLEFPGTHIWRAIKYFGHKLAVFFGGILDCAFKNTVSVIEATLEIPTGTFGMEKCERLDLNALGVPPFYIKIIHTVTKLVILRWNAQMAENPMLKGPFPMFPDRGYYDKEKNYWNHNRAGESTKEKN